MIIILEVGNFSHIICQMLRWWRRNLPLSRIYSISPIQHFHHAHWYNITQTLAMNTVYPFWFNCFFLYVSWNCYQYQYFKVYFRMSKTYPVPINFHNSLTFQAVLWIFDIQAIWSCDLNPSRLVWVCICRMHTHRFSSFSDHRFEVCLNRLGRN